MLRSAGMSRTVVFLAWPLVLAGDTFRKEDTLRREAVPRRADHQIAGESDVPQHRLSVFKNSKICDFSKRE